MSYKVTVNTELANIQPLLLSGNIELGFCKPLVTAFSTTDQYRTLLYMCFCLKAFYLILLLIP